MPQKCAKEKYQFQVMFVHTCFGWNAPSVSRFRPAETDFPAKLFLCIFNHINRKNIGIFDLPNYMALE